MGQKAYHFDFIIQDTLIHSDVTTINPAADNYFTKLNVSVRKGDKLRANMSSDGFNSKYNPMINIIAREEEKKENHADYIKKLYGEGAGVNAEFYPLVVSYDGIFSEDSSLMFDRIKKLCADRGHIVNITFMKSMIQASLYEDMIRFNRND